jgi:hypothetical protein
MAPAIKGVVEARHVPFWNIGANLTVIMCKENAEHTRNVLLVDATEELEFPKDILEILERNGVEKIVARTTTDVVFLVETRERTVFLLNGYPEDIDELGPKENPDGEYLPPGSRFEQLVKPLLESGKSCMRVYTIV